MFKLVNQIDSIDSQINLKLSSNKLYPIMMKQLLPNIGIVSMCLLPLSENESESPSTFDLTSEKFKVKVQFHIYDLAQLFRDCIFALIGVEETIKVASLSKHFNKVIQNGFSFE